MNYRQLIILLFIFVALGSYFYFFETKNGGKIERDIMMEAISMLSPDELSEIAKSKGEKEEFEKVFKFADKQIEKIRLTSVNNTIFYRKEKGRWEIIEPPMDKDNGVLIESLVSTLVDAVKIREFKNNSLDFGEYGLKDAYCKIEIWLKEDPKPRILFLGNYNPRNSCVYARIDDASRVLMVGGIIRLYVG
ncbi:MAG: DUF4340 domain-containing protein, partial [Deltaproteobacteria bacterium]|nr:DUF4340 domain-containing protein [Deltaproteobacteria bacterium]